MDTEHVLDQLASISGILVNLALEGEASAKRDRAIESIGRLSDLIIRNSLKENTRAFERAAERLTNLAEQLDQEKQDSEKSTKNLQRVLGGLGAVAGVVRFI